MSPLPSLDAPSAAEINAIADMQDAAMRNLWITWSYYRLNRAMVAITGNADLTWWGFAVWASKTAGAFIRQQEAGPLIDKWLGLATANAGIVPRVVAVAVGIHRTTPAAAAPAGEFFPRG